MQPTLTRQVAASLRLDARFSGNVDGPVYAQPLYVLDGPGGRGAFFVVTEKGYVFALDEFGGATLWQRALSPAADRSGAGCGNISPLGITGTPYLDLASRTLYVDAVQAMDGTIQDHRIHALSIDDGSERPGGWPVSAASVSAAGLSFTPNLENQRGALLVHSGTLYVPFGGHWGDCGSYHGWLLALPLADPSQVTAYVTGVRGGGSWAPSGVAADDSSVYISTGNTFGAAMWSGGEAILRFPTGQPLTPQAADYFTPSNWQDLDLSDTDLGGQGPLVVDVPGATPSALLVALGKNGVMYLLDRKNLGGVGHGDGVRGEGVVSAHVMNGAIIGAAAAYTTASGTYVVMHGHVSAQGAGCPSGQSGDLVAVRIGAAAPPTLTIAWCAASNGQGSPIVTTTDGRAEAIVWTAGSEGSERLHGFDGDTGAVVYAGGGANDVMAATRRFSVPIAVRGQIFIGGDNRLYRFTPTIDGQGGGGSDGGVTMSCSDFCSQLGKSCTGNNTQYGGSVAVCAAECNALPPGRFADTGDTAGCRFAESSLVPQDPGLHCVAAGPSGGDKCGTRCDAFCTLVAAACVPENQGAANPYPSLTQCLSACASFAFNAAAPELDPANHDTLNCRQYQLQRAWSDLAGGSARNACPNLGAVSSTCNQ